MSPGAARAPRVQHRPPATEAERPRTSRSALPTVSLALAFVVAPGCLLDAALDEGPCHPGRQRVDGRCQDIAQGPRGEQLLEPARPDMLAVGGPSLSGPVRCQPHLETPRLDFGAVATQDSLTSELVIANLGVEACRLTRVSLTEGSAPELSLAPLPEGGLVIPPGRFLSYEVRYHPTAVGAHEAAALLWVGERRLGPVALSGRGVTPGSTLEIHPSEVDYGRRSVDCVDSAVRPIYVRNPTSQPVFLRWSVWPPFIFTVEHEGLTLELAPGRTATAAVHFDPAWLGTARGRLRVDIDGGDARVVPLIGEGGADSVNVETFVGGRQDLFLRAEPVRESLHVFVDDNELLDRTGAQVAWWIDVPTRHLHFADLRIPRTSQAVRVEYSQRCQAPTCGDGELDPGEQCDDGNLDPHDACLATCELAFCGDGFLHHGTEECEDGNQYNGDGCNWLCTTEWCGNGVREPPEQCDDGVRNSNVRRDACRLDCRYAHCGDGVLDDSELCDDGNLDPADSCVDCRWATCGDGHVFAGVEACDDGNQIDDDACKNDCTLPSLSPIIVAGTTLPGPAPTDVKTSTVVRLPFPFRFLGEPVQAVNLSQPGLLLFGPRGAPSPRNTRVGTSTAPNGFVALWWDALDYSDPLPTTAPTIYVGTTGRAPDRTFTMHIRMSLQGAPLSVDVTLGESDGAIWVYYPPLDGVGANPPALGSATVGWESRDGHRGGPALSCSPACSLTDWPEDTAIGYLP